MSQNPLEMPRPVQAGWETIDGNERYPDHVYDINGSTHGVVSEREYGVVAHLSLAFGIPDEHIIVHHRKRNASVEEIQRSVGMFARSLASMEP